MDNSRKKIKGIISAMIAEDKKKVNMLVKELYESIVPEREEKMINVLVESFKGKTNV